MRILYVEDDSINVLIMRKFLDGAFKIDVARDGDECLQKLEHTSYDLVLMDIHLGSEKMNGVQTLFKLRDIPECTHLPVFAVTAFALPEERNRYIKYGFTDYFTKPVVREHIIERIREQLCKN